MAEGEEVPTVPVNENINEVNEVIQPTAPAQPRRVVSYAKIQPGYRITLTIYLLLNLNILIFGAFTLFARYTPVNGPQNLDEAYDFYDILGFYLFCLWNSFMWAMIILVPSLTTVKREKFLPLFYLNGCSTFLIRLSDFYRPATRFQTLVHILINIFSYFLYMAVFIFFYGLPEELHVASRMSSMKPWRPVYEGEDSGGNDSQQGSNTQTAAAGSSNV